MELVLPSEGAASKPERKLLDQVRDVMRLKHYSLRTEQTYCDWIAWQNCARLNYRHS